MGKTNTRRPAWTATLGAMLDNGVSCRATCTKCDAWRDIDLEALAAKIGLDTTLWNKRTRCRLTDGCAGRNRFMEGSRGMFRLMED